MAPMIRIQVSDHEIIIADNGPGIPAETVGIRDFSVRVSSLEAYAFLARNALKTIVAMAFALDGAKAST
jgi:hypothetical protein